MRFSVITLLVFCAGRYVQSGPVEEDICTLPKEEGDCDGKYRRYYYLPGENRCVRFEYTGCGGNNNRFTTGRKCEEACVKKHVGEICQFDVDPGPCYNGPFIRYYYSPEQNECIRFEYGGCAGNPNRFNTKGACENACLKTEGVKRSLPTEEVSPCDQPLEIGRCSHPAVFKRYYYEKEENVCKKYFWRGCDGNGNKFSSLDGCIEACVKPEESTIVRPENVPQRHSRCLLPPDIGDFCDADSTRTFLRHYYSVEEDACKEFDYKGCGGNRNKFASIRQCTRTCVPGATATPKPEPTVSPNPCDLPLAEGDCGESFERYYYSKSEGICKPFIYSGCKGNKNQFISEADCESKCVINTKCQQPIVKGNCEAYIPSWAFNVKTGRCEKFIYGGCDGNDNRFATEAQCCTECNAQGPCVCQLKMDPGPCKARKPMWYYHKQSGQCREFFYGGCQGNGNRFETRSACEKRCPPTKARCDLEIDAGSCKAKLSRWGYNPKTQKCEHFYYGGCLGNANNFPTETACYKQCCKMKTACYLDIAEGPCSSYRTRYGFNIHTGSCEQFDYGGCLGTSNNFGSMKQCRRKCRKARTRRRCFQPRPTNEWDCRRKREVWGYDPCQNECVKYTLCGDTDNKFRDKALCEKKCRIG